MSNAEKLQSIVEKQKALMKDLERESREILQSDLTVVNKNLQTELEDTKSKLESTRTKLKKFKNENDDLKSTLQQKIYDEKIKILDNSSKKYDIYFKNDEANEVNRLTRLENELEQEVKRQKEALDKYNIEAKEIRQSLDELNGQTKNLVATARKELEEERARLRDEKQRQYHIMKNEPITDDVIKKASKGINFEQLIGENILNKVGVLFVILGIIAISRLSFVNLPDAFKGIIMFAISGLFLGLGEFLSRKKSNVFSLGMTSAGVAGLFVSLTTSYFVLDLLGVYTAIILCILITLVSFVLSMRYDCQPIACFALVGGYLPIMSLNEQGFIVYGIMVYFIILNTLSLAISFYKKWKIAMCIGYFLNFISTVLIIAGFVYGNEHNYIYLLLFVVFTFLVYMAIPIFSNYRTKQPFVQVDVIIMGCNTFFSAVLIYVIFEVMELSKYNGMLTIAFAITYIALSILMEKKFACEKNTIALFYLTGLTFVILTVPFQFGVEWLSLGWLIQGVVIAIYGIFIDNKIFKGAGFFIMFLCLTAFVYDVLIAAYPLFGYKYFAFTLGTTAVLVALAYKKGFTNLYYNIYKHLTLTNLWFYGIYFIDDNFYKILKPYFLTNSISLNYLISIIIALFSFGFGVVVLRIPSILDKGVKYISIFITFIGLLILQYTFIDDLLIVGLNAPYADKIIGTIILIVTVLLSLICLKQLLLANLTKTGLVQEWTMFWVSIYFLITITEIMIFQYRLSNINMTLNIIYIIAAFLWIAYGFWKKFAFTRKFGLVIAIFAITKLFLIDLGSLTEANKIVTYFAFGITLLSISFVYQYFSKKLIKEGE